MLTVCQHTIKFELIITTHAGPDGAMDRVLASLAESESVLEIGVRLRIDDRPRADMTAGDTTTEEKAAQP